MLTTPASSWLGPAVFAGCIHDRPTPSLLAVESVRPGHLGMDPPGWYGVKDDNDFTQTHLGQLGPAAGRPSKG